MIINTYPLADQQPTPEFVSNFYEHLRAFLIQHEGQFETTDAAVSALMAEQRIQASVSFQRVTFNELDPGREYPYMIFGWPSKEDQEAFIARFTAESPGVLVQ